MIRQLIAIATIGAITGLMSPQPCHGHVTVYNASSQAVTVQAVNNYTGWPYSGSNSNGTTTTSTTIQPGNSAEFGIIVEPTGLFQKISLSVNGYPIAGITNAMNGPDQLVITNLTAGGGGVWSGLPSLTCSYPSGGGGTVTIGTITPATPETCSTRNDNSKSGACSGRPRGPGMAGYAFHSLLTSLNVMDIPIAYQPPVGPAVEFVLGYNQKEAYQPTNWTYFNLGPKWTLSICSFIQDDPANPTNDVRYFPPGGGSELFTGYNPSNGAYALSPYSLSTLVKTATNSYELRYNNGAKQVFAFVAGSNPRRIFLTQNLDASSNQVAFVYETITDGWVRLTGVVDAIGQTNTVAYTNQSDLLKVTGVTDPFGRTANLTYTSTNGALRLTSVTDPVQITSSFSYGTNDFLNALTTPYGTTTFAYIETNGFKMLTATDPMGATECLQYRDRATITDTIFPAGMILDTNRLGDRNSYHWGKKAWAMGSNDLSNAQITHWATQNGQVVDMPLYIKMPLEGAIWINYLGQTNGWGDNISQAQPVAIARTLDDGTTQKSTLAYDGWGNLTNAVDPSGRSTSYLYATNGIDLLTILRKNGASHDTVGTIVYNSQHLPLTTVINGITNKFGYSAKGQLQKATNALGQTTTYNYNTNGFLTNITGHLATDTVDIGYDNAGRVYSITDSQGYSITNSYDNLNRLTNTALPDATSLRQIYDKMDVAQSKGRDGRWTYQKHDANGHLTDVQDSAGRLFHYEYCSCGALENITDPKGQPTTWLRDSQGRATQKLYADRSTETTVYENLTSRPKTATDQAGKTATLAYAIDNNPLKITYTGGPVTPGVTNTYDTNYSRITQLADGTGTTTIGYIAAGQPGAGSIQTIDGPLLNDTISYGYDALGRVQTVQVGAMTGAAQYDQIGRVWWTSNTLGVTTIQFVDTTGRPAMVTHPNGFGTSFNYTPVTNGSLLQSMTTTNAAGQTVASLGYAYDIRNLIRWQTNVLGDVTTLWNYDYDLAGQLTAATQWTNGVLAHRYSYAYDLAGNRTSEQIDASAATEQANNVNQLTYRAGNGGIVRVAGYLSETGNVTIAGAPARMTTATNFVGEVIVGTGNYTIGVSATDLNANTTNITVTNTFTTNGLDTKLTYDLAGNQITKSNSAGVLAFGWDGADRCTAITNGVYLTAIAYDGLSRWARITEYSNTTVTADRRFVWSGTSLAEERDTTGTNVVQRFFGNGFQRGGTNYFYVKDHLGSVREVYTASGVLQARFEYDPYGRRTQTYGTLWVDFGFAGLFELRNGLKLAVWRVYQPDVARWASRDPIKEDGGLNLYAYCANQPVGLRDSTGLRWNIEGPSEEFFQALAYLRQDPLMELKIDNLEKSPQVFTIQVISNAKARTSPQDHIVIWSPSLALKETVENGVTISPALVLGHELIHISNYEYDRCGYNARKAHNADTGRNIRTTIFDYIWIPNSRTETFAWNPLRLLRYDNEEEYYTITKEGWVAQTLGEGVRTSHRGTYVPASSVTSAK